MVSKDSVKNADFWQQLDMIVVSLPIKWTWMRGHNGHPMNEGADALARAGMAFPRWPALRQGATGGGTGGVLYPADGA